MNCLWALHDSWFLLFSFFWLSEDWIWSIIYQALSKTEELSEIESRYFETEEECPLLLASQQLIKKIILADVCRHC